ncbi:MAG: GerW family sporulation protein [Oscillospiraceae bacterium]|jgi:sporulation protein YtfJ|nr:GerW family sporulation protein [Oscillospiraceae bacterium]
MAEHPIQGMMNTTLQNIREMVDSSTVIGDPIVCGNTTIIPVSKVSYGFASGGSDFPSKSDKELFGGGGGAGITVNPVAFLVVSDGDVKLLQINPNQNTADRVIGLVPDLVDKITGLIPTKTSSSAKVKPERRMPDSDSVV